MPEINELIGEHPTIEGPILDWTDPELAAITRIRFLGDSWQGPWDLSYVHGLDRDGKDRRVRIPTYQVHGKGRQAIIRALVADARKDGVYLKELCGGSFDNALSVSW